jgi:bisphosphoglycerate-independent phosphoglycerate mutase (AlkP superfamily)
MSVDFTGQSWREHLGYLDSPVHDPVDSGRLLAAIARRTDFAFFEYWISDYVGHNQDMPQALEMLANFDRVLAGLAAAWDAETGLILITSDHGNLEDLSTRRHTANPVPGLVVGAPALRREFTVGLHDLTGVVPAVLRFLGV